MDDDDASISGLGLSANVWIITEDNFHRIIGRSIASANVIELGVVRGC